MLKFKNVIKELLCEYSHISFNSRVWTDLIYQLMIEKLEQNKKFSFEIIGSDYPELYKDFGVDKFKINVGGGFEYDHNLSGYENNIYVVYLNIRFKKTEEVTKSYINHEMKHAYEDYSINKNHGTRIKDSKLIKTLYTKDFESLVIKVMKGSTDTLLTILYFYYFLSKVEQHAFIENIYDNNGDDIFKTLDQIKNFEFNNNLSDQTWNEIKNSNIPFLNNFKSKEEFAQYSEKKLKTESLKFRNKINKMLFAHNKI